MLRGESARSADRPELQRLLAYVKANQVEYVIVHKVDRLARNRADDVEITLAIKAAGAPLADMVIGAIPVVVAVSGNLLAPAGARTSWRRRFC